MNRLYNKVVNRYIIHLIMKGVITMERKNYAFYMPNDFDEQLEKVKSNDPVMASMSKSQAVHYIVSKVAKLNIDLDDLAHLPIKEQ